MNVSRTPLHSLLAPMSRQQRACLAQRIGTTPGHLRNVSYGQRPLAPAACVALEREAGISRKHLRQDWRDIWPDLQ